MGQQSGAAAILPVAGVTGRDPKRSRKEPWAMRKHYRDLAPHGFTVCVPCIGASCKVQGGRMQCGKRQGNGRAQFVTPEEAQGCSYGYNQFLVEELIAEPQLRGV